MWLPPALLLLWVSGCCSLSCPPTMTGTVGGSLTVQCQYEDEYRDAQKYWCRERLVSCDKIVETQISKRELGRSRVFIRDNPANLTFTVTMENLTVTDTGTYLFGINVPRYFDPNFKVEVFVSPASMPVMPTRITTAQTSTVTTEDPAVLSTTLCAVSATHSATIQEDSRQSPGPWLALLLSFLVILLLLLVGTSLMLRRKFQKPVRAGEHLELSQGPRQAAEQSEEHYVNLELLAWPLREEQTPPKQMEVEYSTVGAPMEEPHYSLVVFDQQDATANGMSVQRPRDVGPEYSVIKKPRS
ncbi:CMRF35-like molecule 8 isoform X2 [Nycticebus coucang]|uniref:CMRF35-like molecule 8 isoform X2 n=1 Tax=Nycticebus coucang TaxID=9470 RepID=UPI00234D1110|nr:CMRF35-like molecule 8 isoform X2 [Nycticebus coucang]